MANPDSIQRRPEREPRPRPRTRRPKRHEEPEFRETLAPPLPNHVYHSEIDLTEDHVSRPEQITLIIARILLALLAIRLAVSFFSSSHNSTFITILYGLTDWLVRPFWLFFNQPPASGQGFFDLATLAAMVFVTVVAALIIRAIQTPKA